jgi:hypothetical protein
VRAGVPDDFLGAEARRVVDFLLLALRLAEPAGRLRELAERLLVLAFFVVRRAADLRAALDARGRPLVFAARDVDFLDVLRRRFVPLVLPLLLRVSPASRRCLFTVRAAISSARSLLLPCSSSDCLMCSYCRWRF